MTPALMHASSWKVTAKRTIGNGIIVLRVIVALSLTTPMRVKLRISRTASLTFDMPRKDVRS